jgi:hypothetical protein
MNQFLIKNEFLLTGQAAPFTGEFVNVARSRETTFTVYSEGSGSVRLQYKSPFFNDKGVDFYSFNSLSGTGHAVPAFLTSPVMQVRAISEGTGNFWAAATIQN